MLITRRSSLTGERRTLDLPVTVEQLSAYMAGALVQEAFPNLDVDSREFILSGVTPEEWAAQFVPAEGGE
jgi:hypothetical protein